jgi:subtilisin family serine protease
MKNLLLFIPLFFLITLESQAQQDSIYYYQFGEKNFITPVYEKYIVEFKDTSYASILDSLELPHTNLWWTIFEVSSDSASVYQINDTLCTINPLYIHEDSSKFYMRNILVLEWKDEVSENLKDSIITQHQLKLTISVGPLEHYEVENALIVANEMFESGHFKYCYPEFLIEVIDLDYVPSDEYFSKQWYLYNNGQLTNDGHYGTPGADIKALAAWEITTGSSDVIVAVIDRGVTPDHPDLPSSRQVIVPQSNWETNDGYGLSPNQPFPTGNNNHGNGVAGIIAATHNNEGIAGICPECKIMPFKFSYGSGEPIPSNIVGQTLGNCAYLAADHGSAILSFAVATTEHESLTSLIQYATDQGALVVAAAGNFANHDQNIDDYVRFPANIDNPLIIAVGASDRNDMQANYSPTDEDIDVVAPSHTAMASQIAGESLNMWTIDIPGMDGYNPWPDITNGGIPAQDEQLPFNPFGTDHLAYTGRFGGTSAAAPIVSGIAALMLSVNPNLTPEKVKSIILHTADKVGDYNYNWNPERPGHSKEMGYGRVNAYNAVLGATIDLYTEDTPGDEGVEPNENTEDLWTSEDIWVRNQNDGTSDYTHQNPIYVDEYTPVYVYVRVRNRGISTSLGTEQLKLYWSKAATALTWPEYWDGSMISPVLMGDEIGVEIISQIESQSETILTFTWIPPNPEDYENIDGIDQPWHFCLLSRIVADHDPIINELESGDWNLVNNVKSSNNISWKNLSIVNIEPGSAGGSWDDDKVVGATFAIGNASDTSGTFTWSFKLPASYLGNSLLEVAEVRINLDSLAWSKWVAGGRILKNISVANETRFQLLITGDSALLQNLTFLPHERALMNLSFNFLTREFDHVYEYDYHVIQQEHYSQETLGGEKFEIHVEEREMFMAEAGENQEVYRNEQVIISAEEIEEDAIYNWYDTNGNLIHTGQNFTVTPQITTTYRLEVIAETDGFKDYDEVEVVVKHAEITNVSPNPVSSMLTIQYDTKNVQAAYLILTRVAQSSLTNNYQINTELNQTIIDVSSLPYGMYNLILVADGEMTDQTSILIE